MSPTSDGRAVSARKLRERSPLTSQCRRKYAWHHEFHVVSHRGDALTAGKNAAVRGGPEPSRAAPSPSSRQVSCGGLAKHTDCAAPRPPQTTICSGERGRGGWVGINGSSCRMSCVLPPSLPPRAPPASPRPGSTRTPPFRRNTVYNLLVPSQQPLTVVAAPHPALHCTNKSVFGEVSYTQERDFFVQEKFRLNQENFGKFQENHLALRRNW